MPSDNHVSTTCLECKLEFLNLKKLSEHLKKIHHLTSIDYYIKHFHDSVKPTCKACGGETRFVSLGEGFKKYCANDRKIAESEVLPWDFIDV